jgi:hypothetical protein
MPEIDRRDFLAGVATTATIGLAGCGDPSRSEQLDRAVETASWLRPGESFGDRHSDEVWRIRLDGIDDRRRIDLTFEQIVLDEVGQNKEGIDPTYTFERRAISLGTSEVIQDHWGFGYLDHREGEALVGIDDYVLHEDIRKFASEHGPEWYDR